MTRRLLLLTIVAALLAPALDDVILRAMQDELARSKALGVVSPEQPYFIEYTLYDGDSISASASLGALIGSRRVNYRLPRIQVRVGVYEFDNTNFVASDLYSGTRYDVDQFPLDNSYAALRHHLWLATDAAYKGAVEAYTRKRAALKNVTLSEKLPDFARAEPLVRVEEIRPALPEESRWIALVRKLSTVFLGFPDIHSSVVDVEGGRNTRYMVSSEGTRIRVAEGMISFRVRATAQAPDGMVLRDAVVFNALDPDRLPTETEMERGVRRVGENVSALVRAPVGEAYAGPILFEGIAGPQLLAQLLGKNLAVPRKPVTLPGRPLTLLGSELEGRLGVPILPEWMDVVDDPTQKEWRGRPLFGHYTVDLEGVAPKPLVLVEKGVLKNFLLTRQPVKGFEASNGRARLPGNFGAKAAGLGNLFVRASKTEPAAELRKRLIALCSQRNKPYGIIVRKLDFPSSASLSEVRRLLTGMAQSGSRPVSPPILAYRVYPDGREELVRGLRFRGLTARSLKDIIAASDETHVFDFLDNTAPFALMGGANFVSETSIIAPSILIDDLEMEAAQEQLPKPPIVPPPL
ncbi:MAG: metallopeptidase TldD-related protein [Rhodospirillales bacterium]